MRFIRWKRNWTGSKCPAAGKRIPSLKDSGRVGVYIAWPESTWAAYQAAFRKLVSTVDGVERQAVPWPDWAITTVIDTRNFWSTVWRAISCHESQVVAYERLQQLSAEHHEELWGSQSFYRVFSAVNGGRSRETDLLEGISV
jgi:hypothetical protein